MAPHSKRSSASDLVCEANTKHNVWIRRCAAGSAPAVSPIVHARSAQVGIGERESRRGWGQQLVVRGQLHSPMVKLVMRVAHVAPIRARCFNSKRTSFHVALELEHVESVDLRSAIRKADAVLPAFARAGQRGDTLKRVARPGRCRLLFLLGVQHITTPTPLVITRAQPLALLRRSRGREIIRGVKILGVFLGCRPRHSGLPRVVPVV